MAHATKHVLNEAEFIVFLSRLQGLIFEKKNYLPDFKNRILKTAYFEHIKKT